ncbi:MAG TPA: hypothetical protein PKM41_03085 [Deltaproteobacteria bacterium]|jgi:hypothetical protein|nr:hypothetical protein [Deltaproteobacteria bacterium]HOI05772.1 hypothetical protein [Deltaproteobacteria bacterium]
MTFTDYAVNKAILDGRSSRDFRIAAQSNANAAVVYLIIALAVWFFAGWVWALIPAALMLYTGCQSISATRIAIGLEQVEGQAIAGK